MELSPEKYMQRLLEVSQKKYNLLKDMLDITRLQEETINEDSLEELDKNIGQKQEKIDQINKIDEEFDVYFQRLKKELKVTNLDELKDCSIKGAKELKECIAKITGLIGQICELEKLNNNKAKDLLDSIGNKIKNINQGKKVSSAYTPGPVQIPSYYIDKKK